MVGPRLDLLIHGALRHLGEMGRAEHDRSLLIQVKLRVVREGQAGALALAGADAVLVKELLALLSFPGFLLRWLDREALLDPEHGGNGCCGLAGARVCS